MIHYQLRCRADHRFDGWFRSSDAFAAQASAGLVTCPECGDASVERALMAPALARGGLADPEPPPPAPPAEPGKAATLPDRLPDKLRAALQRIRAEIERTSDYVGPDFAEEARRIHRGDSERRSIFGESTEAEAEALAEDGIPVARIPWVPRADG